MIGVSEFLATTVQLITWRVAIIVIVVFVAATLVSLVWGWMAERHLRRSQRAPRPFRGSRPHAGSDELPHAA
jgi:hypothetical protein